MAKRISNKKPPARKRVAKIATAAPVKPKRKKRMPGVLLSRQSETRLVSEIKIGPRHRKDLGNVQELADLIDRTGHLLHPIVIKPNNELVAGRRRLAAWPLTKLSEGGNKPIPVTVIDLASVVLGEYAENAGRKDFTPSELVAIKRELEPLERAKAADRRKRGRKADAGEGGNAADKVARVVGRDRKTIAKAEAVVEAAERDPARYGKLVEDMDRTGRVDGPFKRLVVMEAGDAIRAEPPPLPGNGPYRAGMIDPPWPSEDGDPDPVEKGRAYYPYPTMSIEEICALPVAAILHDDAVVGIWITNYHLVRGHHVAVLKAYGLEGVTMRTWVKDRWGNGQVCRGQTEHLIIAKRGKPVIDGATISTFFHAKAGKLHSEKPRKAYDDFERLVPAPRYFSLFHVGELPANWDGHGNEVGKLAGDGRAEPYSMLDVLELVDAGKAIVDGSPWVQEARDKKFVVGAQKRRLTKAGTAALAQMRAEHQRKQELAALPDTIEGLVAEYLFNLRARHAAIINGESAEASRLSKWLDLLLIKANGGDNFGMACDDSPAEQLRVAARSELGTVPMWGQPGIFRIDVDGTAYIVDVDEDCGDFGLHAVDPDKPCISETGYHGFYGSCGRDYGDDQDDENPFWPLGKTVDQFCIEVVRDHIAQNLDPLKYKPRKGPYPFVLPERVYRIPTTWGEHDGDTSPIAIEIPARAEAAE